MEGQFHPLWCENRQKDQWQWNKDWDEIQGGHSSVKADH